jgi:hypothetical protein
MHTKTKSHQVGSWKLCKKEENLKPKAALISRGKGKQMEWKRQKGDAIASTLVRIRDQKLVQDKEENCDRYLLSL